MKVRKEGYWVLFVVTLTFALCAVFTLLPFDRVSKVCFLGYKASCSFAPYSTLICLLVAGVSCFVRKRFFVTYK